MERMPGKMSESITPTERDRRAQINEREGIIILYSNAELQKFFFTVDHCQAVRPDGNIVGEGWVPITSYLPTAVAPRPGLEGGIIVTREKLIEIFHDDEEEIPNPNPAYAPAYGKKEG